MYKVAAKVKTYFEAHLSDALEMIEAEEEITIPRWGFLETYEQVTNANPRIFVLPGSWGTTYADDETLHPVGQDEIEIRVIIEIEGNDQAVVQRNLLAYREAIRRLVVEDFTFGEALNRVLLGDGDPSPLGFYRDRKEFLQAIEQTLICREWI